MFSRIADFFRKLDDDVTYVAKLLFLKTLGYIKRLKNTDCVGQRRKIFQNVFRLKVGLI